MANRKYDHQQQAELNLLSEMHVEHMKAKAVLRSQIQAQLTDALADMEIKKSQQANKALAAKVTKTDIGRAIGTSNWETIEAFLARTARDFTAADFDPLNKRYTWEGERIRVTLTQDEAIEEFSDFPAYRYTNQPLSALFERVNGGWIRVSDASEPLLYDGAEHPVALWGRKQANRDEIASWATRQREV